MSVVKESHPVHKKDVPIYRDPFHPTLRTLNPLDVNEEQKDYIQSVLLTACSDSNFAQRAYDAVMFILTGSVPQLTITSLVPSSVTLGDPSFDLHVHGTGFDKTTVIYFAGQDEQTTLVSDSELTTGINMGTWLGPDTIEVYVRNPDSTVSNKMSFEFKAPVIEGESSTIKPPVTKPLVEPPLQPLPHVAPATPPLPQHIHTEEKKK